MNAQKKWKPVLVARRAVGFAIVFSGAVVMASNLVPVTASAATATGMSPHLPTSQLSR